MKVDYEAIHSDPALRRGIYGLTELTRFLNLDRNDRLSAPTVARWAQNALAGLEHRTRRRDYSFADLIGMLVVRDLVDLGMRLSEIREAEIYLRQRFGHEHPFLSERLQTDGADVFYDALPSVPDQLTSANRWGQEVFEPTIGSALRGVTYDHSVAAVWEPVEGVYLDPSIQFGEPCVSGTGITTARVAGLVASESSTAAVAEMFGLSVDAVGLAVSFERSLAIAA